MRWLACLLCAAALSSGSRGGDTLGRSSCGGGPLSLAQVGGASGGEGGTAAKTASDSGSAAGPVSVKVHINVGVGGVAAPEALARRVQPAPEPPPDFAGMDALAGKKDELAQLSRELNRTHPPSSNFDELLHKCTAEGTCPDGRVPAEHFYQFWEGEGVPRAPYLDHIVAVAKALPPAGPGLSARAHALASYMAGNYLQKTHGGTGTVTPDPTRTAGYRPEFAKAIDAEWDAAEKDEGTVHEVDFAKALAGTGASPPFLHLAFAAASCAIAGTATLPEDATPEQQADVSINEHCFKVGAYAAHNFNDGG